MHAVTLKTNSHHITHESSTLVESEKTNGPGVVIWNSDYNLQVILFSTFQLVYNHGGI